VDQEGSVLTEAGKIETQVLETLAQLIRGKMKTFPWSKIIDGKGDEWTEPELFEALSTPCKYQCTEKALTDYVYYMRMGRRKYLILYDAPTNSYKIYDTPIQGGLLSSMIPILIFSKSFVEDCDWKP
jgi:hypothetical protein